MSSLYCYSEMILTFKLKHNKDLSVELGQAKQVAIFAIHNRDKLSSKYVKDFWLKSAISNQILRKYGRDRKCKHISKVNLIVPNQWVKVKDNVLRLVPLWLEVDISYLPKFTKVNQVEVSDTYCFISISVDVAEPYQPTTIIGVDRNTNGHIAVCWNLSSGKVLKLWKSALHTANKYKHIRKQMQQQGKYRVVKQIKQKQSKISKDLNHKVSRAIVDFAYNNKWCLVLEDLKWIRTTAKSKKSFKYALNNWSFYQLQMFIEYKAKLLWVPLNYVDPAYTSKCCSRCGKINNPQGKVFKCSKCGFVEHRDVNASFNIALRYSGVQFGVERDTSKSNTGVAQEICYGW